MADDLAALLAGAAKTNADLDVSKLGTAYWEGLDRLYKQRTQDAFQNGVPMKDGAPDWDAITQTALSAGGTSAIPGITGLLKEQVQLGIQRGLQNMPQSVFGGSAPARPEFPPSPSSPGVKQTAPAVSDAQPDDGNMTVNPRVVAAANAPQPAPAAAQPPPQAPLVPRPVATVSVAPNAPTSGAPPFSVPGSVPMPPPRPQIAQAPVAPAPQAVPAPGQQQPPVPAATIGPVSPETEAFMHQTGLVPPGRTTAQHVEILQRAAALASSTGVRDAAKPYLDAVDSIKKVAAERSAPSELRRDYENERMAGTYTGTFDQYRDEQEYRKTRLASDLETLKDVSKQAADISRMRPLLTEALRLSETAHAGYAATLSPYWAKVTSAFGIPPSQATSDTEALKSVAQQLVPLVRQPGATSNFEAQLYLDALISPTLSKEGRAKIGNMIMTMVERATAVARVYRANVGRPDLYDKLAELDKPMFNPAQRALLEREAKATRQAQSRSVSAVSNTVSPDPVVDSLVKRVQEEQRIRAEQKRNQQGGAQ